MPKKAKEEVEEKGEVKPEIVEVKVDIVLLNQKLNWIMDKLESIEKRIIDAANQEG